MLRCFVESSRGALLFDKHADITNQNEVYESSKQARKEQPLSIQLCKTKAILSPGNAGNVSPVSRKQQLTCLIEQQGAEALGVDMRDLGGPPAAVVRPVQL